MKMNMDSTKQISRAPRSSTTARQLSLRSIASSTASWPRRATGRSELKGNKMKTTIATLIALTAGLSVLQAQSNLGSGSPKASTQRAKAQPPLVVATLDANHDGIIDAGEIANASQALKSLDKNADGRLSPEELRRSRPTRTATTEASTRPMKKRTDAGVSVTERR